MGWLDWETNKGSKYEQNVSIPNWIKKDKCFSIECLRGLLETDGSLYADRGYKMVGFVTIIPQLANDVMGIIEKLGFKTHLYKIPTTHKIRYNIRISKNVACFINALNLKKD